MKAAKALFSLIATGIFICMFSVCAFAFEAAGETYQGIDISRWQGDVDFAQVAEDGIRVVYIRASNGLDEDPMFQTYYQDARDSGLLVGAYHYVSATTTAQSRQEAQYFATLLEGKEWDCIPIMDFELLGLSAETVDSVTAVFLEDLERYTGMTPGVYASYNRATSYTQWFARYPLWIAQWGAQSPSDPGVWETWAGFQYSNTGSVSGISGNVDRNLFTDAMLLEQGSGDTGSGVPDEGGVDEDEDTGGDTGAAEGEGDNGEAGGEADNGEGADDSEPPVIDKPQLQPQPQQTHTVVWGDTLWALSQRYGTTVDALAQANQIPDPNLIYVGDVLDIPQGCWG